MGEIVKIPEIVLNSGHKMPVLGMGSAPSTSLLQVEELATIFVEAIKAGYRHFDTASAYGTEEALGKAVSQAVEKGLVKSRDELFITSKLWCTDAHPHFVLPALKKTLLTTGLEYLDLYLIHWPIRIRKEANFKNLEKQDLLPFDIHSTWKAMEECQTLGLTKSIGVSNFTCEKLSKLLENATIPPAVDQVEMSVAWQQRKLLPFCKEKGINLSAWSPLGAYGTSRAHNAVTDCQVLKDIAASRNNTFAQVALRWIYEQGASVMVKSYNKERMRENLKIFDWELTQDELVQIKQIPQKRGFSAEMFIGGNGPYKTVEELWDGDL